MIISSLIYLKKDDAYLMLHRIKKENDINKDKWIGIGGKKEEHETIHECMIREVYEESGLCVDSYEYRGIIHFKDDSYEEEMHLYTSSNFHGTIKTCDEGVLEWVNIHDIYSLPLWEGDFYFLKEIENDYKKFFHMIIHYEHSQLIFVEKDGEILYDRLSKKR